MSYYDTVYKWSNLVDLITNRVDIINKTLDADYCGYRCAPCVIKYRRGVYVCEVCGARFASWRVYDVDSAQDAFDKIDSLADGLWYLMRSGRLFYDSQYINQQLLV